MAKSSASIPAIVEDVQGDQRWMSMHNRYVAECKGKEPEVVFVGDSLIQQLEQTEVWKKLFAPFHCLNFGIGGDATQHVLWRVENGELDNIRPKVIILLVGTNNHDHTAEEVIGGIETIVESITTKQPQAQVVILGIPPRGYKQNRLRDKIRAINGALPGVLAKFGNAQFLDCDSGSLIQPDGTIDHHDLFDYLHFTEQGYEKMTAPLFELLTDLLSS